MYLCMYVAKEILRSTSSADCCAAVLSRDEPTVFGEFGCGRRSRASVLNGVQDKRPQPRGASISSLFCDRKRFASSLGLREGGLSDSQPDACRSSRWKPTLL